MFEKCPRIPPAALLVALQVLAFGASRKSVPHSTIPGPAPAPIVQTVTLNGSAIPLTGPWKFSPGDSPWINNSPLWAQPGFDDSSWSSMGLTPPTDPLGLNIYAKNAVPGWTAKGFPKLSGYAWYRLNLRLADPTQHLSLKMPANVDGAYQVYANGQLAGQFGDFDTSPPTIYFSRPVVVPLPAADLNGEIQLALRFYMPPTTVVNVPAAGGLRQPPVLGSALTLHLIQTIQNTNLAHSRFGFLLTTLFFLLLAPAAMAAWLLNRRERTFLWLSIELLFTVLWMALSWSALTSFQVAGDAAAFWLYAILYPVWLPGWIMVWWYWFRLEQKKWIPLAAWSMALANLIVEAGALAPTGEFSILPLALRRFLDHLSFCLIVAMCLLLLYVLFLGFQRDRVEGKIAAAPIFLLEIATLLNYFSPLFGAPYLRISFFGLTIDAASISSILMGLVIGAIATRRFLNDRVAHELKNQSFEHDVTQAIELQQNVLVSQNVDSPEFHVEVQYRPAQTIGGDFFQVLLRGDDSLLVIIGDVAGQGIPASMLVSFLVGAACARAHTSFDPATMLDVLNQEILSRPGGHVATCLVAQMLSDGRTRIANAGHVAPYLNGSEISIVGSIPLGIAGKLEPALQIFKLRPGDRITFITNGVTDARNSKGELFGFDRVRIISNEPIETIADRAQQFGQTDDITVLRVFYTAGRQGMGSNETA